MDAFPGIYISVPHQTPTYFAVWFTFFTVAGPTGVVKWVMVCHRGGERHPNTCALRFRVYFHLLDLLV